jgi:hypothetical protein
MNRRSHRNSAPNPSSVLFYWIFLVLAGLPDLSPAYTDIFRYILLIFSCSGRIPWPWATYPRICNLTLSPVSTGIFRYILLNSFFSGRSPWRWATYPRIWNSTLSPASTGKSLFSQWRYKKYQFYTQFFTSSSVPRIFKNLFLLWEIVASPCFSCTIYGDYVKFVESKNWA